jgi:hypothetical protein
MLVDQGRYPWSEVEGVVVRVVVPRGFRQKALLKNSTAQRRKKKRTPEKKTIDKKGPVRRDE